MVGFLVACDFYVFQVYLIERKVTFHPQNIVSFYLAFFHLRKCCRIQHLWLIFIVGVVDNWILGVMTYLYAFFCGLSSVNRNGTDRKFFFFSDLGTIVMSQSFVIECMTKFVIVSLFGLQGLPDIA